MTTSLARDSSSAEVGFPNPASYITVSVGANWYNMVEFNGKLARAALPEITRGLGVSAEFSPKRFLNLTVQVGRKLIPIGIEEVSLFPTLQVDYLSANSRRSPPEEIEWTIPVAGFVFMPSFEAGALAKADWLEWRPIGVGYYKLGWFGPAKLTREAATGRVSLAGGAVGFVTTLGIRVPHSPLLLQTGYRWLRITDVTQDATGDWTGEVQSGTPLPESLDYSGPFLRAALRVAL